MTADAGRRAALAACGLDPALAITRVASDTDSEAIVG